MLINFKNVNYALASCINKYTFIRTWRTGLHLSSRSPWQPMQSQSQPPACLFYLFTFHGPIRSLRHSPGTGWTLRHCSHIDKPSHVLRKQSHFGQWLGSSKHTSGPTLGRAVLEHWPVEAMRVVWKFQGPVERSLEGRCGFQVGMSPSPLHRRRVRRAPLSSGSRAESPLDWGWRCYSQEVRQSWLRSFAQLMANLRRKHRLFCSFLSIYL